MRENMQNTGDSDDAEHIAGRGKKVGITYTEEFDLIDLFNLLYGRKFIIMIASAIAVLCGMFYLANSTSYYVSETVFIPAPEKLSATNIGSNNLLGGVGSVLGIGGSSSPETSLALSILQSRDFLFRFFDRYEVMPQILSKYWNASDEEWRPVRRSFLGKVKDLLLGKERDFINDDDAILAGLAFKEFRGLMSVDINKETEVITLGIVWTNPVEASQWANQLMDMLNEEMRVRAISQSQERVKFLQTEINQTRIANIRNSLSGLMELELKKSMIANVEKDFAFTIIDRAYPQGRPFKPRKILILILCLIGGFLMSSTYFMGATYIDRLKSAKG